MDDSGVIIGESYDKDVDKREDPGDDGYTKQSVNVTQPKAVGNDQPEIDKHSKTDRSHDEKQMTNTKRTDSTDENYRLQKNTDSDKQQQHGNCSTPVDGTMSKNRKNVTKTTEKSVISVDIKGKVNVDDINPYDSVSNIRSYPDKTKTTTHNNSESQQSYRKTPAESVTTISSSRIPKKMKKGIFVSYSPDAGFYERKFVVETVRQLKENNLSEDIWFDKDEKNTDSPCWFSTRMEAVERCKAAILFLSDSYFMCPVSVYEGKVLLDRFRTDPRTVKLHLVLFSHLENTEIPKQYNGLLKDMVDLADPVHTKKSLAEKTSVVIGSIMESLEKFASINSPPTPTTPPDAEFTGNYKKKKICQWSVNDLQEWLFNLGIKEFYRQSLAENMVDGFLLMSLTDHDMIHHLGIDSRVVRKKIMQQILQILDKEHKQLDNWHLKARAQRPKSDLVYLIYDPTDVRLAQNMKADLRRKNVQVIHHDSLRLGKSKEEFLQINGANIATATNVVVIMTEATASSPFVFQEVMFADWLGKKLLTALFKNTWPVVRPSLKAVLGECPSVDFETKMYAESLDVLEHHIKPLRRVPGVVLEQGYLNKMAEGLKPLEILACSKTSEPLWSSDKDPQVFISYQWDMQDRVNDIKQALQTHGISCWADIHMTQRGHSGLSSRSSLTHSDTYNTESLSGHIQRSMKTAAVVLSCVTPKYLQSDSCLKDLTLAESLNKPILPVLFRFSPTEGALPQVRKILAKVSFLDLSTDRLYKQNLPLVVDRVVKIVSMETS